jgi:UrcA family protein
LPAWPSRAAVPQHSPKDGRSATYFFQQPLPETTVNTKSSSSRLLGLYAATIVCAVASSLTAVCAAADSSDFPSVVVKFADLNLSNPAGVTALYRRINAAARDVCKSYDIRSGSSTRPGSADPCVRKALQDAVNKVGHPALLAMYNAKHPQPGPITVASARTR